MPQMIWATITGASQGEFKSDITRKGFEGKIDVLSYDDSVSIPYDGSSGLPAGRRQHGSINFSKDLDKSSPLLANAAFTNENLTTVKFEFLRPAQTLAGSAEKVFLTVTLTNAIIASITRSVSGDRRIESLSLVFQKINITYLDGGVSADDNWSIGYDNQT